CENSEVLPAGSLAVAVDAGGAATDQPLKAKAVARLALVVAVDDERTVVLPPKPAGSQLVLQKRSTVYCVLGAPRSRPFAVPVVAAVSTGALTRLLGPGAPGRVSEFVGAGVGVARIVEGDAIERKGAVAVEVDTEAAVGGEAAGADVVAGAGEGPHAPDALGARP